MSERDELAALIYDVIDHEEAADPHGAHTSISSCDVAADAILARWRLVPAHDGTHHWADLRPPSHLAFVGGAAGYVFRHCVWCGQWADTPTQICPGGWYTGGYRAATSSHE